MLQEYAIRPEDFTTDWRTFNFLKDKFGILLGRVISDFPRGEWVRLALDKCQLHGPKRSKVVAWFEKIDGPEPQVNSKYVVLVDRGRQYHETDTWTENASREHKVRPFCAVISDNQSAEIEAHGTNEIWDSDIWGVDTGDVIERKADKVAGAVRPLLKYSTEILLVDPHFRAYEKKYRKSFESIARAIDEECVEVNRFEVHLSVAGKHKDRDPIEDFARYSRENLSPLLPDGMQVLLYRWENMPRKERMHPRYVLTDLGGIRYDYGLDAPKEESQTTDVQLLTPNIYEKRWDDYQVGRSPFKLHDGSPIPVKS
jgi:hypothetical protein